MLANPEKQVAPRVVAGKKIAAILDVILGSSMEVRRTANQFRTGSGDGLKNVGAGSSRRQFSILLLDRYARQEAIYIHGRG